MFAPIVIRTFGFPFETILSKTNPFEWYMCEADILREGTGWGMGFGEARGRGFGNGVGASHDILSEPTDWVSRQGEAVVSGGRETCVRRVVPEKPCARSLNRGFISSTPCYKSWVCYLYTKFTNKHKHIHKFL